MPPETDLSLLLKELHPILNPGEYVFTSVKDAIQSSDSSPLFIFREAEGMTLVMERARADELQLPYSAVQAWITLGVYSSLEAVGLTAAVSNALTRAGIPCNMVAGYHHDHCFVPIELAYRAMEVLQELTR